MPLAWSRPGLAELLQYRRVRALPSDLRRLPKSTSTLLPKQTSMLDLFQAILNDGSLAQSARAWILMLLVQVEVLL